MSYLIYTHAAALEALQGIALEISYVRPMKRKAVVVYRTAHGQCATFVSSKKFGAIFAASRKAGAEGLDISEITYEKYRVTNSSTKSSYLVELLPSGAVFCECPDHARQVALLGEGCCKHCYAIVHRWLGFASLRAYQVSKKSFNDGRSLPFLKQRYPKSQSF
jgi:hypothetical protein